jgi:hypothetical protein
MALAFDQFETAFDAVVKLSPAASIIAAIVAARFTFSAPVDCSFEQQTPGLNT